MGDRIDDRSAWAAFVEQSCADLGVDPNLVDVDRILELTALIAHESVRPMAPIGAFIVGLAVGSQGTPEDVARTADALTRSVTGATQH